MMTISGPSLSITAFSSLATASGCNSTSVSTKTPRSAPIARPVRIVSWHCCTPAETMTQFRVVELGQNAPPERRIVEGATAQHAVEMADADHHQRGRRGLERDDRDQRREEHREQEQHPRRDTDGGAPFLALAHHELLAELGHDLAELDRGGGAPFLDRGDGAVGDPAQPPRAVAGDQPRPAQAWSHHNYSDVEYRTAATRLAKKASSCSGVMPRSRACGAPAINDA